MPILRNHIGVILLSLSIATASFAQDIVWESRSDLPKPMRGAVVASNDTIYLMEADPRSSGVYEYNPLADNWRKATQMVTPGWNVNLADVGGMIHAIGGDPFRNRNERYDPQSGKWQTLSPMPTARQHTNASVVDGKIYVIGGLEKGEMTQGDGMGDWAKKATVSDKNEVYDPILNTWETRAPLPTPRQGPSLGAIRNRIFAVGGATTSAYDSPISRIVEVYDVETDSWQRKADFPIAVLTHGVVSHQGKLYGIGGQIRDENGKPVPTATVYVYNEKDDEWSRTTDLPHPIQIVSTASLGGYIYVIGGCGHDFRPFKSVWRGQTDHR